MIATKRNAEWDPNEADEVIRRKLGENGWERWQTFRRSLPGNPGTPKAKSHLTRSEVALLATLESLDFRDEIIPSLFLTDEGRLELAWRDADGKAIQIEFGPAESEIYVEASEYESTVPNRELPDVVRERVNA